MSESDRDFLKNLLGASSPQQILVLATLDNLASLPPETADTAYRCLLVHWFNEDVIAALTAEGVLHKLGRPFDQSLPPDPANLYRQLQTLPFVEEYAGRGHRFHDLTRHALLDYLWREENDFYRVVSELAVDYFDAKFSQQPDSDRDEKTIDWDLLVELAYHYLVAYEAVAREKLPDWLDELMARGLIGQCHALVQVAEEHAAARRLTLETAAMVRFWRSHVAYLTNDYALVETIARELMTKSEDEVPGWVRATVSRYWAESLRLLGQYDEAQRHYNGLLEQATGSEPDTEAMIEALLGLGRIAETRAAYQEAEIYYEQALDTAVRMAVVMDMDLGDEDLRIGTGLDSDAAWPPGLQLYEPESWQSLTLYLTNEEDSSPAANGNGREPEQAANAVLLYSIEIFPDDPFTADPSSASDEDEVEVQEDELIYVVPNTTLAHIWLRFGYLYQYQDEYDLAAACARLAGEIYEDLENVYGMQQALQLIHGLGALMGDLELVEMSVDYQHTLLALTREQHNRTAELESLLALAYAYENRDDFARSRENYTAAWELAQELDDPGSVAVALEGLARLDWTVGHMETADTHFQQALALYRQLRHREGEARLLNSLAGFELGRFHAKAARQHAEAALALFRELRIPSGEMDALITLGEIYQYEQKFDESLAVYEQALALARQPSDRARILNGLGLIYSLMQQNERAAEIYQEAWELTQDIGQLSLQSSILLGLGDVALAEKRYDDALNYYEQADEVYAQLDSHDGRLNVLFGLLAIHQVRQERDKAVKRAEETVSQAKQLGNQFQIIRAMRSLSDSLISVHDYERALLILDEALELSPTDPQTLSARGDLLLEMGEYETAVTIFDQALELDQNNATLWQSRGWALENLDLSHATAARASYEKAVALKPDDLWSHKGIGNALRLAGEPEAACARYRWIVEQLLAAGTVKAEDFSLLGWCYYSLGEYVLAIHWLRQAIAQDTEVISDLFDLALCHLCLGDDAEAVLLYEQGVQRLNQWQAVGRRGKLFVARTDLQEAIDERPSLAASAAVQTIQRLLADAWQEATTFPTQVKPHHHS